VKGDGWNPRLAGRRRDVEESRVEEERPKRVVDSRKIVRTESFFNRQEGSCVKDAQWWVLWNLDDSACWSWGRCGSGAKGPAVGWR